MNTVKPQSSIHPSFRLPKGAVLIVVFALAMATPPLLAQPDTGFKAPQDIDGSRLKPGQVAPQNPLSSNQASTEKVFDQLVREMDNLIPGEFEEGSEQKKAIEEAITAFQLRDPKRVVEIFNQQAAADPDFPPTDLLLAGLSYAIKDKNSGQVLLERAAMQFPESPAIYSAFSRLAINEGRITDALALLEKMERVDTQKHSSEKAKKFYEFQFLDGMIDVSMRQQRYDDARGFLTRQLANLPNNPKVLMVFAELEFREDNLEKSMAFLTTLRQKFPPTRAPEAIIATWYQRTGQAKDAEKWVLVAAEKYPNDAKVQLEYASWAVNQENFPVASAAIKKAESADSETPFSKTLKAKIAFARQSYVIAESHYGSLYQQNPDNFDAANMYALCLIESDDLSKRNQALEIANKNFRTLPDNIVAQAALGYVRLRLGSVDQAKPAMAQAAKNPGTSPEIDFFVGSLLIQMNQAEGAKRVLEGALKHEGLFLYRSAAQKILAELNASELPSPTNNK